jgi:transcriptional regulator of acetoin/glycerol metabolism
VRELVNVVDCLFIDVDGPVVTPADVVRAIQMGASGPTPENEAMEAARKEIVAKLERLGWNVKEAARSMNVSRSTLYRIMKKLGIHRRGR